MVISDAQHSERSIASMTYTQFVPSSPHIQTSFVTWDHSKRTSRPHRGGGGV